MRALALLLLRFYKRRISPLFPPACRFVPTCSEYAIEAFEKKSFFTALGLTVVRIAKCHPFHPGGFDPVK
jgi:hypothetical protein